jgi:hypothetical protein
MASQRRLQTAEIGLLFGAAPQDDNSVARKLSGC